MTRFSAPSSAELSHSSPLAPQPKSPGQNAEGGRPERRRPHACHRWATTSEQKYEALAFTVGVGGPSPSVLAAARALDRRRSALRSTSAEDANDAFRSTARTKASIAAQPSAVRSQCIGRQMIDSAKCCVIGA